jgi:hypothetical protein
MEEACEESMYEDDYVSPKNPIKIIYLDLKDMSGGDTASPMELTIIDEALNAQWPTGLLDMPPELLRHIMRYLSYTQDNISLILSSRQILTSTICIYWNVLMNKYSTVWFNNPRYYIIHNFHTRACRQCNKKLNEHHGARKCHNRICADCIHKCEICTWTTNDTMYEYNTELCYNVRVNAITCDNCNEISRMLT